MADCERRERSNRAISERTVYEPRVALRRIRGALFYVAVSSVELVVEGTIRGYFGRRRMEAAINKLSGHYILCGYGRVGRQVATEFALDNVPFVIVEQDPATVEECGGGRLSRAPRRSLRR